MNDARQGPIQGDPAGENADERSPAKPSDEGLPPETVDEPTGLNPEAQPGIPDETSPAEGGD